MISLLRLASTASVLALSVSVAAAAIERTVEKTFNVTGHGTLRVETQGGGIRVEPSSGSTVKVTAKQRIRANSDSEADELLKKLELTIEQEGNNVRVVSRYERKPSGWSWSSWPPVNVDFVVTVPAKYSADLHTSGGSITVGDLAGPLNARTSGGSITLGKMGGEVEARTSGGSITLQEGSAPVELSTSGGNITVGRVAGTAKLSTSGGNIRIDSASNMLRASTSGGNIRAAITGPLTEDSSITTSGGSVRVAVDKAAAFRLDASSSGGSVDADGLTLTLESASRDRNRLAGTVNGGGPTLKLRSSGGSVSVRTN
jgi:hypothetical protein